MENKRPVILIFDVGKTNKKVLLFNRQYQLVYEESKQLPETEDEDGFACEDVHALTAWVKNSYQKIQQDKRFEITAVNVSAYGASFVHLDDKKQPFLPLYNYLKPYDETLQKQFYKTYGGEETIAKETASPILGHLNSGMQLYWLKHRKPEVHSQINCSLHLPQYISFILCGSLYSDITSIGCHTHLWDFKKHRYHDWIYKETIDKKLAPIISCAEVAGTIHDIPVGSGLHDSSAALIPYFTSFNEPFVLLSTGTWSISINPFNHTPLTSDELNQDCLSYLSYQGDSVKASRLFAGYEHEQQVKRLAEHYHTATDYYKAVQYDASICNRLRRAQFFETTENKSAMIGQSAFSSRNLHDFETCEEAYHQLILDISKQQVQSTKLVMQNKPVKKIFVDGGFSKNDTYMNLLAAAFPHIEIYSATVAQASALGAAIAIKRVWNDLALPENLIAVKRYKPTYDIAL